MLALQSSEPPSNHSLMMEKILEHLQDPDWWFNIVFMAMVISIPIRFLQIPVDKFLSQISSRAKMRRAKREELFETHVGSIAKDGDLILFNFLRGLALLITALFLIAIFVGSYLMYRFSESEKYLRFPSIALMIISGLLIIKNFYRATYRFKCCIRAKDLYAANRISAMTEAEIAPPLTSPQNHSNRG